MFNSYTSSICVKCLIVNKLKGKINMKKKNVMNILTNKIMLCATIGIFTCGLLVGCGGTNTTNQTTAEVTTETTVSDSEYQTYEFETFDGNTVLINESNIVSQEACKNALEWKELPTDAEQIAPGRDFVLFEYNDNYFVEDAANELITIATK